jgi:hypothetical protein
VLGVVPKLVHLRAGHCYAIPTPRPYTPTDYLNQSNVKSLTTRNTSSAAGRCRLVHSHAWHQAPIRRPEASAFSVKICWTAYALEMSPAGSRSRTGGHGVPPCAASASRSAARRTEASSTNGCGPVCVVTLSCACGCTGIRSRVRLPCRHLCTRPQLGEPRDRHHRPEPRPGARPERRRLLEPIPADLRALQRQRPRDPLRVRRAQAGTAPRCPPSTSACPPAVRRTECGATSSHRHRDVRE